MSLAMTTTLVGLLHWALPILAWTWAIRSHNSRAQVVLVSAGAALVAGLVSIIPLVHFARVVGQGFGSIPAQLGSTLISCVIFGIFVGIVGVVVQKFAQPHPRRA